MITLFIIIIITAIAAFAAGYTVRGLLAVALERKRHKQLHAAYLRAWSKWSRSATQDDFPTFKEWRDGR